MNSGSSPYIFVASSCPRVALGGYKHQVLALTPFGESERVPVYEFPETHFFHTCVYYDAYPWNGILGERSISCRYAGVLGLPALASAAGREIQEVVWIFNNDPYVQPSSCYGVAIRETP
jgi:hypothetical protein